MRLRLVVLAAIAVAIPLATPGAAAGSCVQQSSAQQHARAEVIVEGVILAGAEPGRARLRVSRYLKGNGPRELAIVGAAGAGVMSSIDIEPAAGERWRVLGTWRRAGTVVTSVCDGSARVDELGPLEPIERASAVPVARVESGDGTPAWLLGPAVVLGAAALLGTWLRRSRRSGHAATPTTP